MSDIQEFYKNANILITGGTGFLGKLLVEKLLRSCDGVNHIYLLMRNKNGFTANERMEKYFEDQVFVRLRLEKPGYITKVSVIPGDMEGQNLNLINDDKELIINSVNIIFHAAATVSFNQTLRVAVEVNLHGIRKIMELSKRMKNLKALIHISTVYSNCNEKTIEEKIYTPNKSYKEVIELLRLNDDHDMCELTPDLLGEAPNTYVFTKALAEKFISDNHEYLPIGIFRPAIVVSTAKEPIRGWIDNFYGPTGLIASAASGFLHVMHGGSDVFSNIVPADMVVNAIIASGWDIGQKGHKLPIYNFVSTQNPVSWGEYVELTRLGLNYPFSNSIWYMSLVFTRRKWLYDVLKFALHVIPAFILDITLRCFQQKPHFLKKYTKIHNFVRVLSYFTNKDWEYKNDHVIQLWTKMTSKDKCLFNFDISTLNWNDYFKHYMKGIRVYLFKDELKNLQTAQNRYQRLYWLHQFCKYSTIMFVIYYFCCIFGHFRQ